MQLIMISTGISSVPEAILCHDHRHRIGSVDCVYCLLFIACVLCSEMEQNPSRNKMQPTDVSGLYALQL